MCGEDVADNGKSPRDGIKSDRRRGEPHCGYGVGGYSVDTVWTEGEGSHSVDTLLMVSFRWVQIILVGGDKSDFSHKFVSMFHILC